MWFDVLCSENEQYRLHGIDNFKIDDAIVEQINNLVENLIEHVEIFDDPETHQLNEVFLNKPEIRTNEEILNSCVKRLLFLLGKKLPSSGSLSMNYVKHLLLQHDGRFAEDSDFLFYLIEFRFNFKIDRINQSTQLRRND